jgi:hypothetical protein
MFDSGIGAGVDKIIAGILGITVIGLILSRSSDTGSVISAASTGFGNLIKIATFRN